MKEANLAKIRVLLTALIVSLSAMPLMGIEPQSSANNNVKIEHAKKILINSGIVAPDAFNNLEKKENLFNKTLLNTFSENMSEAELSYLEKVFASNVGKNFKNAYFKAQVKAMESIKSKNTEPKQ